MDIELVSVLQRNRTNRMHIYAYTQSREKKGGRERRRGREFERERD